MVKINFKKLPLKWYHTTRLSFCFLISISQTLSHVSTITSTLSPLYVATDLFCTVILYLMIKNDWQSQEEIWLLIFKKINPCSLSSLSVSPHNYLSFETVIYISILYILYESLQLTLSEEHADIHSIPQCTDPLGPWE